MAETGGDILLYLAGGFGVLSLLLLAVALGSLRRRRWLGGMATGGSGALLLALAALSATLSVSTQGYRALTTEALAATITTVPTGEQSFQAYVERPGRRDTTFAVAGDQLLVDAHILKWHPWANVAGLHTLFELDRLSGRYVDIDDERRGPRTVHSLKGDRPLDLFRLTRRHGLLSLLVDAEYGSATYIEVDRPARFQVRVSTSGLLIREVELSTSPGTEGVGDADGVGARSPRDPEGVDPQGAGQGDRVGDGEGVR